MKVTHKCGAAWSGSHTEHCSACHLTFANTTAGDAHRVGDHGVTSGPDRRRCLTVEEMQAKVFEEGARKGDPWFRVKENPYGTEVWSKNVPNTLWKPERRVTDGLTDGPVCDGPGSESQAACDEFSRAA